jgi:hypothetical protein
MMRAGGGAEAAKGPQEERYSHHDVNADMSFA